jgi:hypothetical protein
MNSSNTCYPAQDAAAAGSCVLCTVYSVQCTVYSVLCTVYCVLCTVHCVRLKAILFRAGFEVGKSVE